MSDRIDLLKENQDFKKELDKYKKAFDNACEEFAYRDKNDETIEGTEDEWDARQWKEWCLKDE